MVSRPLPKFHVDVIFTFYCAVEAACKINWWCMDLYSALRHMATYLQCLKCKVLVV